MSDIFDAGLRLRVHEELWRGPGLSLFGVVLDHNGKPKGVVQAITVQEISEKDMYCEFGHCARLSHAAAKMLMDDLWRAGVRPSDPVSGDERAGAMERHLGDMRKLVAHFTKCTL